MTRKPPPKAVPAEHGSGRLHNARAFLADARSLLQAKRSGTNANPALSLIALAAVAYTDALTARLAGKVNQKDHLAAIKLLKECLSGGFDASMERRLRRLIDVKHVAEYGARPGRFEDAEEALKDLESYAKWIESELGSRQDVLR